MEINGKELKYNIESRAIDKKGKDVTDELKQYGLKPNDLGDIDRCTENMTEAKYRKLKPLCDLGIITGLPTGPPTINTAISRYLQEIKKLRSNTAMKSSPEHFTLKKEKHAFMVSSNSLD